MNKRKRKIIANIVIIALLLCGVAWIGSLFIFPGGEYTNNAQVRQDIVPVSSRVQGFVEKIYFDEFQRVEKGDTLLVIQDSEYRLRLAQAEADYQNALAGRSAMGTTISATANHLSVTDASIREVEIEAAHAENEHLRYKNLFENRAVTRQQFDAVKTKHESLKAKLETMQRQKRSTLLAKDEQTLRLEQNEAHIEVARAALDLAKLNLSYTVVLSPCSGYTSRRTIQESELVMPGKQLLSVIDDEEKWILANYRETQRKHIQVGSKVSVRVDAFPDTPLEGEVAAISHATGAQFSPASPDHSAGNFVKVEQRIPVKILLTRNNPAEVIERLGTGMNAECKILR